MDAMTDTSWVDLSSRQLSIWLELQSSGSAASYQIGGFTRIARAIDPERFRRAVGRVVAHHEALRLEIDPLSPRQRVRARVPDPVEVVDLSGEANPEEAFLAMAERDFVTPFGLDRGPLVRISLVRVADDVWYSLLRCHHLVMDGLSVPLLISLVSQAYGALGTEAPDAPPSSTYLDFVAEDAAYRASPLAARDLAFWKAELADLPPPVLAPRAGTEGQAGAAQAASAMLVRWELGRAHYGRFTATCETLKLRPMGVLVALAASLVHKLSESDDVVLGIAIPGRSGRAARHKLGMFNGAMPLRLKVGDADSLADLATKAGSRLNRAYRSQRPSVDTLCRTLEVAKTGRRGIFEVFLSFIPAEVSAFPYELDGTDLDPVILRGPEANPLAIYISEASVQKPVSVEFAFNPAYLDRDGAQLLMERFQRLITRFTADPHAGIASLNLFDAAERRRIRALQESPGGEPERQVRILASFTADPLAAPLRFWLDTLQLPARIEIAEYNVLFQELLNPESGTRANADGANLVLLRVEDWMRFRAADAPEDATGFIAATARRFLDALAMAARDTRVPLLFALCPPSPDWDEGGTQAPLQAEAEAILKTAADLPGVSLVDYRDTRRLYPTDREWDEESDGLGHVPLTPEAFAATATMLARRLAYVLRRKAKVVVADCDNTLWGGVVGEDGVAGLRLTKAHLALQRRLVEAAQSGMLVCLCSKNVEQDVRAVLDGRDDMILRAEHVVACRINWQAKSHNIASLAAELDLGLDSFVFIDDNPLEIAEVEAGCPGVLALPFVAEGPQVTRADHLWPLDVGPATAEDKKRTRFYRENAERAKLKETSGDFAAFIASLDLQISIVPPAEEHLSRLEQLTERTNQFNINGIRRPASAFSGLEGAGVARAVFVKDRFGDYGLVGALLARPEGGVLQVQTLLMSCRVLGRGVEHAMVAELGRLAQALGCATLRIEAEITARNLPVRQFLATLPGDSTTADGRPVHMLPAAAAAAFAFRPHRAEAAPSLAGDAAPSSTATTARAEPAVPAPVWQHIATALADVPAIVAAVLAAATVARASATAYRAPRTPLEHDLCAQLAKLLGLDRVGIDDNLFEAGLHSLLAVQFVAHVRTAYAVQLSIRALFENPTVAALARAVADGGVKGHTYSALVPIQAGDGSDPLFCIHPANGDAVSFMRLARAMGPDQTVFGLEASGLAEGEPLAGSVEEMAEAYIAEIKTVRPEGPYHFLGWSFGGPVAYEMARRLSQRGEKVGRVIFMDSPTPYGRDDPNLSYEQVLQIFADDLESIERRFDLSVTRRKREVTIQNVIDTAQRMGVAPPEYSEAEARRKIAVYTNCVGLFRRWTPRGYDGDILQFRAIKQDPRIPYDWQLHTSGKVTTVKIKCNHVRIGFEPFVVEVARRARAELKGETAAAPWWRRALSAIRRPTEEKTALARLS